VKLAQSFEVKAPLETVWAALVDVERVAPCLPGASVSSRNQDGSYTGEFVVKIGPTSANYAGKLQMVNVDEAAHAATMDAAGTDRRGQGGAKATIAFSATARDEGATVVTVDTDYRITGRLARFGRGGMIEEIGARLLGEFALALQEMVGSDPGAPVPSADVLAAQDAATEVEVAAPEPEPEPEPARAPEPEPEPALAPEPEPVGETVVDAPAPVQPDPEPEPDPEPVETPAEPQRPASEPLDAGPLVRRALVARVRQNPAPVAAAVVGLLVVRRIRRRRR
jgi:carbon monoxide dehydrogenase subunit G